MLETCSIDNNENNFVINDFIKKEDNLTSDEEVCSLFRKEEKVNDCLENLEFVKTLNVDSQMERDDVEKLKFNLLEIRTIPKDAPIEIQGKILEYEDLLIKEFVFKVKRNDISL